MFFCGTNEIARDLQLEVAVANMWTSDRAIWLVTTGQLPMTQTNEKTQNVGEKRERMDRVND